MLIAGAGLYGYGLRSDGADALPQRGSEAVSEHPEGNSGERRGPEEAQRAQRSEFGGFLRPLWPLLALCALWGWLRGGLERARFCACRFDRIAGSAPLRRGVSEVRSC